MNKFYGVVGYATFEETALDVYQEVITERTYVGDVLKSNRKWTGSEHLNDNLVVSNRISIIADPFMFKNYGDIRYLVWMGTKWKVTDIEVAYPRLILTLGGVYNEQAEAF